MKNVKMINTKYKNNEQDYYNDLDYLRNNDLNHVIIIKSLRIAYHVK